MTTQAHGTRGYGGPPPPPQPQIAAKTNSLAIASLIFAVAWLFGVGSLLGVILGHVALGQIKRTGESGRGLAIAGIVLGYLALALIAVGLLL